MGPILCYYYNKQWHILQIMVLEWISSELVLSSMFERKLFFFTRKSDVIIRQRKIFSRITFSFIWNIFPLLETKRQQKSQGSFLNRLQIFPNIWDGNKVHTSDNWTIDRDKMSHLRSWLWFLRKVQYYNCNEDLLSSWWRAHKVFSLLHHFTGPTRSWWSRRNTVSQQR